MFSLLHSAASARSTKRPGPPRSKLHLEPLESRTLLSGGFGDSFEAPTFNPSWSMFTQSGSISLTTAVDHSGQRSAQFSSTDTGANKYQYLFHNFDSPTFGQTSAWIYDTGAGQPSSNYISFQVSKRGSSFSAGLTAFDYGFRGGGPGYGDQYNYFDSGQALPTGIERTLAWHQYSVVDTPQALTLLVDGVTVYTGAGGSPFDQVMLYTQAPYWRPPWTAYFDDFGFGPVPSLLMESVQTPGPAGLSFSYSITGPNSAPFDVDIYRSASQTFDPTTAFPVGKISLSGNDLSPASHTKSLLVANGQLVLQPDPSHPYVLAVADPTNLTGESDSSHDQPLGQPAASPAGRWELGRTGLAERGISR